MGDKLKVGVLVLALIVSLGFDYYYINLQAQNVALLNNMRSQAVNVWAREMFQIALLVKNATTNSQMRTAFNLIVIASDTAQMCDEAIDHSNIPGSLYWQMINVSDHMIENLGGYAISSYPGELKYINPSVFPMFKNLNYTIYNMTHLIFRAEINEYKGVDPAQQLAEKDVLNDIIAYCIDIGNLSKQLLDFNPKFQ